MIDSLSTSIDSALDDDNINFIVTDAQIRIHAVDLAGNYVDNNLMRGKPCSYRNPFP